MKNSKSIFRAQHLLRTCIAVGASLAINSAAWAACSYTVTNNWGSGFTAEIKVTNNTSSTVNNWSVSWQESGASITSAWNATLSGSNPYSATGLSWNSTLAPGASATFGLQGNGTAGAPVVNGSLCGTSVSSSSRSSSVSSSISSSRSSSLSSSSRSSSSVVVISSSRSSSSSISSSVQNVSAFTIQEEQAGFCRVDGIATEATNTGFTGNGYTNANNAQGASIVWAVSASTSSRYTVTFRYANGGTNSRNGSLLINGGSNGNYTIQLPTTSGWANWQTVSVEIDLVQGNNILQLSAQTADGLANIDSVKIEGASSAAGTCPAVSSSSSSSRSSSSASSRSSTPSVNTATPIGFASTNGGTTGGKNGQTVSVSNYADLKRYAESSDAYTIMINGTISNGSSGGQIRIASNKSLIGVGSSAFLSGVGLDLSGSTSNVIVRNLKMTLVGVSTPSSVNGGDVIGISGSARNIWIDHCELYSENPSSQTNIDKYDGLIDIKGQTSFITLSYNYLHDHHKGGLVGAADDDLYANRKVTMHHNYYRNVKLRVPMYRGAVGHFFNNYIVGAQDATEIRANTCLRVERNYYEALHYSIYTPSDSPGKAERISNIEVSRTSRAYPSSCTADIPYDYSSVLISNTEEVKTKVPSLAGVGKI
jgi:pectate lyase